MAWVVVLTRADSEYVRPQQFDKFCVFDFYCIILNVEVGNKYVLSTRLHLAFNILGYYDFNYSGKIFLNNR